MEEKTERESFKLPNGIIAIKSLDTKNGQLRDLIELGKLRKLAIEWIKKDLATSEDEYLNSEKGKKYREHADKLPNGKFCFCDPETSCPFHREGKRLIRNFSKVTYYVEYFSNGRHFL